MTDVALGAVPAPGTGSPESPVGRSEAVAHTAEAGGHALEIQMLRVGAQLLRIDLEGKELVDVCTGTGKFPTLEDYLLRPAILGRDDRGGASCCVPACQTTSSGRCA